MTPGGDGGQANEVCGIRGWCGNGAAGPSLGRGDLVALTAEMARRSPYIAAGLSLLAPGAGQLYSGDRPKGVALLCITAGLWASATFSLAGPAPARSDLTLLLLAVVYAFVLVPAVTDAYRMGEGRTDEIAAEKLWYVVMMLLAVGPFALPLLWQSRRFSTAAKLAWTAAVTLIALLAIWALVAMGPAMERILGAGALPGSP